MTACLDSSVEDELDVDDAAEGDESKADIAGGTYTYYFVRPDLRRCLEPHCGGVHYRLANARKTRCLDGKMAESCYAASYDLAGLGLSEAGTAKVVDALNAAAFEGGSLLVRARIGSKDWGMGLGRFAELRATEAWLAQGPATEAGPVAKIEDTGIACITTPCPSLRERKLNSSLRADIAELGWDKSGATDEQIGKAYEAMQGAGLIVSGFRYTATGLGGEAPARSVTQFWFKATDDVAQKTCYVGGCSGQLCTDEPGAISTCEWREEYACYRTATCEVQADGECGWTQTAELQACLANN